MKKVLKIIGKWLLRILLGVIGLIILVILVFNIFKGKIIDKALDIANEKQPGIVELANIRLRPLIHFPDVSLQLEGLSYSEDLSSPDSVELPPILRMDDIYVSLDLVKLIKGSYVVNKVRLGKGEINYIVSSDSVSNVERALGIEFGSSTKQEEVKKDSSSISLDLENLELKNITLNYQDETGNIDVFVRLKELNSAFSYLPELITAELDLNMGIERAVYDKIEIDHPRALIFNTALNYDLLEEKVSLGQSTLDIKDAVIDIAGEVLLEDGLYLDVDFKVKNTGIELLNFLLKGILDMDAIEQIGSGEIELGGELKGSFGEDLPLIVANFRAEDLGFKVKAINQSVRQINFKGTATNGSASDLSEAEVTIEHFHASMPDGEIDLEMKFSNLVNPNIALKIDGEIDLDLVNNILDTEDLQGLEGMIKLTGAIDGSINKAEGQFLDRSGSIRAELTDVNFSVPGNEVEDLNGELVFSGRDVFLRMENTVVNGNIVTVILNLQDLTPNFLGFETTPTVGLTVRSDEIWLDRIISDTAVTNQFTEPIMDFFIRVAVRAEYEQIMDAVKNKSIPELTINLQGFNVTMPGYAPITNVTTVVTIEKENIRIGNFKGKVGTSPVNLFLEVVNYDAFLAKDTASPLELNFELASKRLNARELLTYKDNFLILPETYIEEEMEDFLFKGKVETRVGELLKESGLPDFRFSTDDIHWDFKYYPLSFRDFEIDVEHVGNLIKVNTFEGRIGESNIKLKAEVADLLDSTKMLSGNLEIESELLDLNELLNYELMADDAIDTTADSTEQVELPADTEEELMADETSEVVTDTIEKEIISLGLDAMDIPDFQLNIDIGELRYEENTLYGLLGQIRSIPEKIIYLDQLRVMTETGGTVVMDGQFNVIDPEAYTLSATFDIDTLNVSDFKVAFSLGDSTVALDETFTGTLDARGIAELYFLPDMNMELANSTASFNLSLKDGRVMNFTPLQAAAKYTGSANLNNVKFGEVTNRFTLVDEIIYVPQMSITTTLAPLVVEGEQGLDGHYLYLVRIPPALISGTAKNMLSGQGKKENKEDEVAEQSKGSYVNLTVSDKGVKPGDRREEYYEEK